MGYFRQFDDFDPLTGQPPAHLINALPTIASKARAMLKGRTRDQIISAANTADWLINDYIERTQTETVERILEHGHWVLGHLPEEDRNEDGVRHLLENWPWSVDGTPPYFPTIDDVDEIDALRETIDGFSLADDPDFPDGQDYEYFSVLALWKIADAIKWLNWDASQTVDRAVNLLSNPIEVNGKVLALPHLEENHVRGELSNTMNILQALDSKLSELSGSNFQYRLAIDNTLVALEAVCYAEHLKLTEKIRTERDVYLKQLHLLSDPAHQLKLAELHAEAIVKKRISDANTKAAIKRHTENHAMKKEVFEWCSINLADYPSMDSAAGAIAGKLVPVTFRTARTWISEYRKKLQSPRRL